MGQENPIRESEYNSHHDCEIGNNLSLEEQRYR
jgi:hypothetical protein